MLDVQEKRLPQARARVEQRLKVGPEEPGAAAGGGQGLRPVGRSGHGRTRSCARPSIGRRRPPSRTCCSARSTGSRNGSTTARAELDAAVDAPIRATCRPAPWRPCWCTRSSEPAEAKRRYQELLEHRAAGRGGRQQPRVDLRRREAEPRRGAAAGAAGRRRRWPTIAEAWDTLGWVYLPQATAASWRSSRSRTRHEQGTRQRRPSTTTWDWRSLAAAIAPGAATRSRWR